MYKSNFLRIEIDSSSRNGRSLWACKSAKIEHPFIWCLVMLTENWSRKHKSLLQTCILVNWMTLPCSVNRFLLSSLSLFLLQPLKTNNSYSFTKILKDPQFTHSNFTLSDWSANFFYLILVRWSSSFPFPSVFSFDIYT